MITSTQTSQPDTTRDSQSMLAQGRGLALEGVPLQLSGYFEALNQLRAKAAGSTADIFPQILPQLSQLRSTYAGASQALARKLGFSGGGQVERGKQQLLGQAAQQYAGLLGGAQQAGFSGYLNTLGAFQPALSASARPPQTSTETKFGNPFGAQMGAMLGGALPGQIATVGGVVRGFGATTPTTTYPYTANTMTPYQQPTPDIMGNSWQ